MKKKLAFVVNRDVFFLSHRLPIALAAINEGHDVYVITVDTGHFQAIRDHGITPKSVNIDRQSVGLGSNMRTLWQLERIFKQLKPDIVHMVSNKPMLLGGIAAVRAKVPAAVFAISGLGYVHISDSFKAKMTRFFVNRLYPFVFKHPNFTTIFQNQDDRELICRLGGIPADKVAMINGSGVDLKHYKRTPLPTGDPMIVMASRLLVDKGAREFAYAARLIKQHHASCRFVLVGDTDAGNPAKLDQTEIDAWVEEGIIEHWGHREDIPDIFAHSAVVVLPSYREGLPKVLLEAAACARAVVTTDVPGCRDAIIADKTGFLVPARDCVALAHAIEVLINDKNLCQSMGEAGRVLAEEKFDIKQVVDTHMAIYTSLANHA